MKTDTIKLRRSEMVMPHGKHEGKLLHEVPIDFLHWLVEGWDGVRFPRLIAEVKRVLRLDNKEQGPVRNGLPGSRKTLAPSQGFNLNEHHDGPQSYKELSAEILEAGNYFPYARNHAAAFGTLGALVVGHVANIGKLRSDGSGWLLYTPAFCSNGTGIDAGDQDDVLDSLQELEVMEVEGFSKTRRVRLDVGRVRELVTRRSC